MQLAMPTGLGALIALLVIIVGVILFFTSNISPEYLLALVLALAVARLC